MSHFRVEAIVLGFVLAVASGSAGWYGWRSKELDRLRRPVTARRLQAEAPYQAAAHDFPSRLAKRWAPPAGQPRGPGWVYELFTPPEIFYDEHAVEFSVTPPGAEGAAAETQTLGPVGLKLVAVKRVPFPLQLLGFVGDKDRWVGSFEKTPSGEVFLAAAGHDAPMTEWSIAKLTVQRRFTPTAGPGAPECWVAEAIVRHEGTGRETTLIAGERSYTGELMAIVELECDREGEVHELHVGDTLEGDGRSYTVERLGCAPDVAEITVVDPALNAPVRLELAVRSARPNRTVAPGEEYFP